MRGNHPSDHRPTIDRPGATIGVRSLPHTPKAGRPLVGLPFGRPWGFKVQHCCCDECEGFNAEGLVY